MKKILSIIIVLLALLISGQVYGAFGDPFVSIQLATDPDNGECLTTDGTDNIWSTSCGSGSGSSLSTTTPWTAGDLVQVTDDGTVNSIATSSLNINTDDLAEGSNLFYTLARVQSALLGGYDAIFGNSTSTTLSTTNASTTRLRVSESAVFEYLGTGIAKITSGVLGLATAGVDYQTPLTAGVDYEVPLTFGDGLTRTANNVDCDTASGSVSGCLSSTNFTIFNDKLASSSLPAVSSLPGLVDFGSTTATTTAKGHLAVLGNFTVVDVYQTDAHITGDVDISGTLTLASLNGFLKATGGVVSTSLIDLASDITGILPIANGGTNASSLSSVNPLWFDGTRISATSTPTASRFIATSTSQASRFPYASTTALTTSGTAYFAGSGIWNASGSVGIGSTTPHHPLSVQKAPSVSNTANIFVNGSGLGGSVLELARDSSPSWESVIRFSTANLGASALQWKLGMDNDSTNNFYLMDDADNKFLTAVDGGSTGSIGIGKTPATTLDVQGTASSTALQVNGNGTILGTLGIGGGVVTPTVATGDALALYAQGASSGTASGGLSLKHNSEGSTWRVEIGGGPNSFGGGLWLTDESTRRLIISSSGNVVIPASGTLSIATSTVVSSTVLHAEGNGNVFGLLLTNLSGATNRKKIGFGTDTESKQWQMGTDLNNNGGNDFWLWSRTLSNFAQTWLSNGNVGIGTTSPYAKLSVVGETVAQNFTATSTNATSTMTFLSVLNGLRLPSTWDGFLRADSGYVSTTTLYGDVRGSAEVYDDWLGTGTAGKYSWLTATAGTGGAIGLVVPPDGTYFGALQLGVSGVGSYATTRLGQANIQIGGAEWILKADMKLSGLISSTNDYQAWVGMSDNWASGGYVGLVDRAILIGADTNQSSNWLVYTKTTGVAGSYADTGIALSTDRTYLKFVVNQAGTEVKGYVNDTLVVTKTTNIPSGSSNRMGPGMSMYKDTSTTGYEFINDYYDLQFKANRR